MKNLKIKSIMYIFKNITHYVIEKVAILKRKKRKLHLKHVNQAKLKVEQRPAIRRVGGFGIVSGVVSGASLDGALEMPRPQASTGRPPPGDGRDHWGPARLPVACGAPGL